MRCSRTRLNRLSTPAGSRHWLLRQILKGHLPARCCPTPVAKLMTVRPTTGSASVALSDCSNQKPAVEAPERRMASLGREHVFAGVESSLSPGNVLQRQLTARLLTDIDRSANVGKGRIAGIGGSEGYCCRESNGLMS